MRTTRQRSFLSLVPAAVPAFAAAALVAVPLVAASGCGDGDAPGDTALIQAALDGLAQSQVSGDQDFLGVGFSVRLEDGRLFRADAGYSDPDHHAAYDDAATEQVIGSVTKLYTAVVTMQLVEAGQLSLDDTLDRWFDFAGAHAITVRMLLNHTAGIADFMTDLSLAEVGRSWTPQALVERALAMPSFGAPPLAEAVYSNTHFTLLALIDEAVSGKPWAEEVEDHIVRPLGLEHTYYVGESAKAGGLAGGWMLTDQGWLDSSELIDPSLGWGVGSMVTTNDELMRFTAALFDGELFDDPTTLARMLAFDTVMDPTHMDPHEPPTRVGLAVMRMQLDDVRLDGHLGHIEGYNAAAVRDPDSGALIVVTSNDDRAFAGYTALAVAKLVRDL